MSADTISRKAALKGLEEIDCSDGVGLSALKCDVVDEAVDTIKALPTVDAVEVVRCKDCIRFLPDGERWGRCQVIPYRLRKDDFCSYGLRKDGDGNG